MVDKIDITIEELVEHLNAKPSFSEFVKNSHGDIFLKSDENIHKIATLKNGELNLHKAQDPDSKVGEEIGRAQDHIVDKCIPADKRKAFLDASNNSEISWKQDIEDKTAKMKSDLKFLTIVNDTNSGALKHGTYKESKKATSGFTNFGDGKFYKDARIPLIRVPIPLPRFAKKLLYGGKAPDLHVDVNNAGGTVFNHSNASTAGARLLLDLTTKNLKPGEQSVLKLNLKDGQQPSEQQQRSIDKLYAEAYKRGVNLKIQSSDGTALEASGRHRKRQILKKMFTWNGAKRRLEMKKAIAAQGAERAEKLSEHIKKLEDRKTSPEEMKSLLNRSGSNAFTGPRPITHTLSVGSLPKSQKLSR